ncbi:hypothetical protein B0T26DRAFT_693348 [Lasiosphaeria miniovina]|uniref:Secreted protein n=1 Tax=Lasiosphaeria miniovina TaxID=1954250 RepID=A0AA40E4W4_9PEZI|nr:uncharacterized protein B0T26DRAFT_693348 [Lasiosphaeria miniovina]KAK0727175.1 hypothetical protein B0T26DRAFT_693348 [Lasiosphaeria miniovina]
MCLCGADVSKLSMAVTWLLLLVCVLTHMHVDVDSVRAGGWVRTTISTLQPERLWPVTWGGNNPKWLLRGGRAHVLQIGSRALLLLASHPAGG